MSKPICTACVVVVLILAPLIAAHESSAGRFHAIIRAELESARTAPDRWPDLSPTALQDREAQDRVTLAKLNGIRREELASEDRTLYDLLDRELRRRLEQFSLRLYLTPYWDDGRFGPTILQLPDAVRNELLPSNVDDAQRLLRKLESFPGYIKQLICLLRRGKDAGMLPASQIAQWELGGVQSLSIRAQIGISKSFFPRHGRNVGSTNFFAAPDTTKSPFYRRFASLPPSIPDKESIDGEAKRLVREQIQPAIDSLRDFLAREYVPACNNFASLSEWPNGNAVYAHLARRYTTTHLEPEEIHQLGLKEVARIRDAMREVLVKAGQKTSLDEFLVEARTSPRFYFDNDRQLVTAYQTTLERILPLVPKVVSRTPRTRLAIQPGRQGGPAAAYMPLRPGMEQATIVVDVKDLTIRPKFEVLPLTLHEGVPGHHLQIALDMESHSGAARRLEFEQKLRLSDAFTEGWALYAEGLGDELGLFADPLDKFGRLSMDLTRAVRLVIDSGIHAYGWSAAKAREYFIVQTGKAQAAADEEITRTLRPGTQLAYKVGEQRILAMRRLAQQRLGPKFDLRRFNDALLDWGPLPLDILERKLDECLPVTCLALGPVK